MSYQTLIDCEALAGHVHRDDWRILDCRFDLLAPQAGHQAYETGHIPGALYAHLNQDLSGPVTAVSGRHPLPDKADFSARVAGWGIGQQTQVVVYDSQGGAIASRLWWMLRWLGHSKVALLDGGLQAWLESGLPLSQELNQYPRAELLSFTDQQVHYSVDEIETKLANKEILLLDARDAARFRGEVEPIDLIAGHIPGAVNLPYAGNLDAQGRFLTAQALRDRFHKMLHNFSPKNVVHMCGSGVTACHNLIAMEIADLPGSVLFPGSWSEWISGVERSVIREVVS